MTKSTMAPVLIALFGLTLIFFLQVSSLCLLSYLSCPLSERGSGRGLANAETSDETPVKAGDGRRDA
jgi:hypothetical protein